MYICIGVEGSSSGAGKCEASGRSSETSLWKQQAADCTAESCRWQRMCTRSGYWQTIKL